MHILESRQPDEFLFSEQNRYDAIFGRVMTLFGCGASFFISATPDASEGPLVDKIIIISVIFPCIWICVKIGFLTKIDTYRTGILIKGIFLKHWIPFACLKEIGPPSDLYFRTRDKRYGSIALGSSVIGNMTGNKTNTRARKSIETALKKYISETRNVAYSEVKTTLYLNPYISLGVYLLLISIPVVCEYLVYA